MNRLMERREQLIDLSHALRDGVLANLADADLDFRLGGDTLSLRELLTEHGTFQMAYTRAFQTSRLRFDLAAPEGLDTVPGLRDWFAQLDGEMLSALGGLSDEALQRPVDRGGRFSPSVEMTFFGYRETLLILAAKASVYLRALGHPLPPQLRDWVA